MDRTKVPTKHEATKAFFVALRDAFLMWKEAKIKELEDHTKAAGMTVNEIQKSRYHSPRLYHSSVDRCVPRSRELCIRVQAVYVSFGHLEDSKTGKPLCNAAAWKRG
jgi:hypothetical protein